MDYCKSDLGGGHLGIIDITWSIDSPSEMDMFLDHAKKNKLELVGKLTPEIDTVSKNGIDLSNPLYLMPNNFGFEIGEVHFLKQECYFIITVKLQELILRLMVF